MSREEDEKDGALRLSLEDSKKMKPPNKKKFDEDMDGLTSQIKEREVELEMVRQAAVEIKQLKTERMECVNRRKQIVVELERINKEIPDRMKRLNEIEASLYYKNEDKINSAIQRLEWNLNVKTYKLTEEKKIVSEIDSLKRSKKNLVQYLTLKQEISEIRDRQKDLREGRDRYTKEFNRLKAKEDELRSKNRSLVSIKREIDALYEQRRQTNANFKQQRGEFQELKEKQKKESLKKKAGERKFYEEEKKRDWSESETERLPHESDLHTCQTLTLYLNRLLPSLSDTSHDSLSPSSSQDDPEPVEEIEDGQYKLLRKSDDADSLDLSQGVGGVGGVRRLSKRNRKFRKLAMDKTIAHPGDVLSQFVSLNLKAPTCLHEVSEVLEQLEKKRSFYEKEQQLCEATSDAGISATESAVCGMSRQASKTESCEGGTQESGGNSSRPDDSVYAALFQQQQESVGRLDKQEELRGAVGGRVEDDDWSSVTVGVGSDTPNSDSTIEGETTSCDSPNLVLRQPIKDSVVVGSDKKSLNESKIQHSERREMKRSLAISVSDSTDSSSLVEQQSTHNALAVEEEFPSLLESSQSSVLSESSFPSLGTSGGSSLNPWQDSSSVSSGNTKQAVSPSSSLRVHKPLTKTFSVVPQDSTPPTMQQMPKSKSYASSVVGRARSFSEVKSNRKGGGNSHYNSSSSGGMGGNVTDSNLNKSAPPSSKLIQPPSSLSLSPAASINTKQQLTTPTSSSSPSSKPKSSLHRSRTLTPTLTRSWAEVRERHRKSSGNSSGSGGGGGGNITPSGSFSNSSSSGAGGAGVGRSPNTASTPTNSSSSNYTKTPLNVKAQVSPSLSSSAIPTPHKSSLSPRLSYPLQSKPSLATPTQPMIVIDDDKDFPPLAPITGGGSFNNSSSSRRNSSLSTKSSSGSVSLHDRDTMLNPSTATPSDNNNNNSSSSNSYLDTAQGFPSPSARSANSNSNPATPNAPSSQQRHKGIVTTTSPLPTPDHNNTKLPGTAGMKNVSGQQQHHQDHTVINSNLSTLPKGDKSSTEKWVESSVAFVQGMASCGISEADDDQKAESTSL